VFYDIIRSARSLDFTVLQVMLIFANMGLTYGKSYYFDIVPAANTPALAHLKKIARFGL
jgi:hypothetical protein